MLSPSMRLGVSGRIHMWILSMQSVSFQVTKIVTLSTRFYHLSALYGFGGVHTETQQGLPFFLSKNVWNMWMLHNPLDMQLCSYVSWENPCYALPPCSRWYDMISCFNYWVASQYNFLFWIEIGTKCSEYERAHPDLRLCLASLPSLFALALIRAQDYRPIVKIWSSYCRDPVTSRQNPCYSELCGYLNCTRVMWDICLQLDLNQQHLLKLLMLLIKYTAVVTNKLMLAKIAV